MAAARVRAASASGGQRASPASPSSWSTVAGRARGESATRDAVAKHIFRDRWCCQLAWQGSNRLLARPSPQVPGPAGHDAEEARPLHQRRPRHHEPLRARGRCSSPTTGARPISTSATTSALSTRTSVATRTPPPAPSTPRSSPRNRRGDFLGKTVQVIPHVTDEIKDRINHLAADDVDVVITEVGGTVGDIEILPFLEAVRQFRKDVGRDNVCYVHLTLVPYIGPSGEQKTKPTQHSVTELRRPRHPARRHRLPQRSAHLRGSQAQDLHAL